MYISTLLALVASTLVSAAPQTSDPVPTNMASVLQLHNAYRAHYGVPPLAWSANLAAIAKASTTKYGCGSAVYTLNNAYGENVAFSTLPNASVIVQHWYQQSSLYNFNNPAYSSTTSQFTQMVWKATGFVGCDWLQCPSS